MAYRLLKLRRTPPGEVLDAALSAPYAESKVLLLAMAVSLAGDQGQDLLQQALERVPNLAESPDVTDLASVLAEVDYTFSW